MEHILKPVPRVGLRVMILIVFLLPLVFSSTSWLQKLVIGAVYTVLFGSFRRTAGRKDWTGGLRIGFATSPDGIHWTKSAANPVLDTGRDGEWDSRGAYSLDVIQKGGRFHVWYAGAAPRENGKGDTIRIGYAVSKQLDD